MNRQLMTLGTLAIVLSTGPVWAADDEKPAAKSAPPQADQLPFVEPPAAFDRLRKLVGKWEGTEDTPDGKKKVAVEYQLTSAGTVLTERLFPGKPHEMFTLYHGDGDDILMTHYCALGNQPRMKLAKSGNSKMLKFVFVDGTSMESADDPHMHQLKMTFVDGDRIKHEWEFHAGGKRQRVVRFELERVAEAKKK